ncbi:MAG: hypothetical protein EXS36_11880 [Pedosphaera sp.]|nr:hypothetical protein [Pedosphaera sp.]
MLATTLWSVVRLAGADGGADADAAHDKLCKLYWYPLYAFARRRRNDVEAAKDLTQGFFAHLLETKLIARADRNAGKFRSYLLRSFIHFTGQEHIRANAIKRGGGIQHVFIDAGDAESRYRLEPAEESSADKIFERRWAVSLLERVWHRLEQEMRALGKGDDFEKMQDFLAGDRTLSNYAELSKTLGMSEGALRYLLQVLAA